MNTDNLTSALNLLAEKLGVAVSEVYNVLITQARVVAIKTPFVVIGYGLIIFAAVLLAKKCFFERTHERYDEKVSLMQHLYDDDDLASVVTLALMNVIMCVIAVVVAIALVSRVSNGINALMNPQFWALDYVLDAIG